MNRKYIKFSFLLAAVWLMAGCQKEFTNPNAADGSQVIKSADGLTALIVGLRREFSVGATSALYNAVSANGLTTRELYVINTGNGELAALENGRGTVGATNSFIRNIWTSCNIVKANAQLLINNASNVKEQGTTEMITAYGHMYKALAIGTMAQYWEQVPTEVVSASDFLNGRRPSFKPRLAALQEAVDLLNVAAPIVEATQPSLYFRTKVGTDINIRNVVYALLARYNLMLGKNAEALAAANKVTDLTTAASQSVWRYDAQNPNPVFRTSLITNNVYNGLPNFGLPAGLAPEAGDGRVTYFLGNNTAPVKVQGYFKSDADPIPLYLPGEILLIRAEALAHTNDLAGATTALNAVRTKANDPFGINAKLAPYSGENTQTAILTEIYKQRCIELYMTGLKLEDSRRFIRPGPEKAGAEAERTRNWYPYPQIERDNNPDTPTDPQV